MGQEVELIVRALIIRDRKILVCQTHEKDYFYLPGGHVEFGETMHDALRRELYEEMGAIVKDSQFIGGIENIFVQDGAKKHEVSFAFHVEIDSGEIRSRESHLSFYWFSMEDFIEKNVVPGALKDAIVAWTAEREAFFIEEGKSQ